MCLLSTTNVLPASSLDSKFYCRSFSTNNEHLLLLTVPSSASSHFKCCLSLLFKLYHFFLPEEKQMTWLSITISWTPFKEFFLLGKRPEIIFWNEYACLYSHKIYILDKY